MSEVKYKGYRDARLTEPMAAEVKDVLSGELADAQGLYEGAHVFDKAHLVMLAESGLIDREGGIKCLQALREMESEGLNEVRKGSASGVHSGENYLINKLGIDVGGLIHAGRSTGDLLWVSSRIRMREDSLTILEALNSYRESLLMKARENTHTILPLYTHGQHAMPASLALYLHASVCAAERDFVRMSASYDEINVSVAGVAAGNASRFPISRERTAELMGFASVSTNTKDGSHYDYQWQAACCLTVLIANLGSLADLVFVWVGQEYRLVELADSYCHTSSIYAHKRNPTSIEIVQETCSSLKSFNPAAYSIWDYMKNAKSVLACVKIMSGAIRTLKVNRERMLDVVSSFWAQIPDLGAVIVQEKNLPWRIAHQTIANLVRMAEEENKGPSDITTEMVDQAAMAYMGKPIGLDQAAVQKALDPVDCVNNRTVTGSSGPEEMKKQIEHSLALLKKDQQALAAKRNQLNTAAGELEKAIDKLVN